MRRGRERGALARYRASHRFQALFERSRPDVKSVTVAVESVDRRCNASDIVAAFPCNGLEMLELTRQIGRRQAILPLMDVELIGQHGDGHSANSPDAPGDKPPRRPPVVGILVSEEVDLHAFRIGSDHIVSEVFAAFCHQILSAPQRRRITS